MSDRYAEIILEAAVGCGVTMTAEQAELISGAIAVHHSNNDLCHPSPSPPVDDAGQRYRDFQAQMEKVRMETAAAFRQSLGLHPDSYAEVRGGVVVNSDGHEIRVRRRTRKNRTAGSSTIILGIPSGLSIVAVLPRYSSLGGRLSIWPLLPPWTLLLPSALLSSVSPGGPPPMSGWSGSPTGTASSSSPAGPGSPSPPICCPPWTC